ncbi:MAG: uroporphyrinogen-III C-methyltransferase [Deltaproteobacteria bacterium]|nr:uroporphyrinogen-III C-methyltransferase [Deltaproteobacteria bacterium]
MNKNKKKGKVFLVGAGPGDPGLLTIRAKECIEKADVLVYDYLANEIFLDHAKPGAELIYVGKKAGSHTKTQDEINAIICEKALSGLVVTRLKGGDPFIFGRGGEEAQELLKAGVSFEIVPGITSAISVPAYAGIPLTHRDHTATVAFVTGHEDPSKDQSNISWEKLSTGVGTIVFLMGIGNLENICHELVKNGRSPETPVAVIYRGTHPEQKTITGSLDNIYEIAQKEDIKPPGIIIVGEVVGLRKELNWFETKPLFGKRIVVTRAREQASGFLAGLRELGANCIEFPTIEIIPPADWAPLDKSIEELGDYNWLLFTSVNGVKYFFKRLYEKGKDVRALKDIKAGAIGPKTAEALREYGIIPDMVPSEYRAEAVIEAFKKFSISDLRILLPRAEKAREILPHELRKMGAQINVVDAYRTIMPGNKADKVIRMLEAGEIDMITFTSSSTVTNFMGMFKERADQVKTWLKNVAVASIGPVTSDSAKKLGLNITVEPADYTIDALTEAIVRHYS